VLEGTGLEESARGLTNADTSLPAGDQPSRAGLPSNEPRPEIWFRRRVRLVPAMRELWDFRELVMTLAERDLRVRYKQAVLGIAWAVLTPLAMMIVFTVVFTQVGHINAHTNGAPYALFAYLGLLAWTFFASAVTTGGMSLVGNLGLLNKLYCPREVFPIAAMLDAAADALIGTVVLLVLFPITGYAPKPEAYFVPLLLIPLVAFTLGVTMAVSSIVVFMRDLRLLLPLVIQLGLFVTPVIYSSATFIKSKSLLIVYSFLNPLAPVLDGLRRTVLQGLAPSWGPLAAGTVASFLTLYVGFVLFKRLETGIADVA
jgi:ABC-2 type transport system permease protein/lipopolysaccharide transport system permease protein